jgi:hypothetical protein
VTKRVAITPAGVLAAFFYFALNHESQGNFFEQQNHFLHRKTK